MGLVVYGAQSRDRHVGIELGGGQTGMPEQLLDHPQVGSTFKQMGGRAVTQPVRPHVGAPSTAAMV